MGHVLGNDNVKNVKSVSGKEEVDRVFWTNDMKCRVARDELVHTFSIDVVNLLFEGECLAFRTCYMACLLYTSRCV